jgi:uncharacterized protein with ParB-like and HNH nuclease domain
MEIRPTTITIADYTDMLDRGDVVVNREYQRSDQVWPAAARSFLIESVLLGFPIPKLSLHQRTDVKSRRTIKEVVDGQQRTKTIHDFINDEFRLSRTMEVDEAAGNLYSELDDGLKESILAYGLNFDLFVSATEEEVREVFRRMNSFTVPLNPEELRHATFQGPFKWFVNRLTSDYDQALLSAEFFTQKQLVRMQDSKLITEICSAYFDGISTTDKRQLDKVYTERDDTFPEEKSLNSELRRALDLVLSWDDIFGTSLAKPFQLYALVLAAMHLRSPIDPLQKHFNASKAKIAKKDVVVTNLTRLADALDRDSQSGRLGRFVKASAEQTNVGKQRSARFKWFCRALSDQLPK